jgi:hypothetical protein
MRVFFPNCTRNHTITCTNCMIFIVQESYLDPQFLRIVKYAKSGQATLKGLLSFPDVKAHNGKKRAFLNINHEISWLKKVTKTLS